MKTLLFVLFVVVIAGCGRKQESGASDSAAQKKAGDDPPCQHQ